MTSGFGLSATARASLLQRLSRRKEESGPGSVPASPGRDLGTLPGLRDIELVRDAGQALGLESPYFRPHEGIAGARSVIGGREYLNFSSYNYLGLNGDPRVQAAASAYSALVGDLPLAAVALQAKPRGWRMNCLRL